MSSAKYKISRHPYMVIFEEKSAFKDTYGGQVGFAFVECLLTRPVDRDSDTVVVFSHPIGGGAFLPIMGGLAKAGHHILFVNTRYRGNDSALIMEKCVVDLGAGIRDACERFGYKNVILGGWSGGGSLSLFYQEQAEHATITETPAGDAIDLTKEELRPADAMMIIAAHVSRAVTLTEWMDASIIDETDPNKHNVELDLYDPANPNQPPYCEEFLQRYRAEQIARNRRISSWVTSELETLRSRGCENEERGFVVHGTMADPRFLDPTIDPNQREPGRCYLGDPRIVNNGPVGLARFCTLRSWLSQWSYEQTNAHGQKNAARTNRPTLVIGNMADDACTPSHTKRLYEAIPHEDKTMLEVDGATHYYAGQPDKLAVAVGHCTKWLAARGFYAA
jgi:pimeloyl-ACP methyl ester carboxylesterase